MRWQAAHGAVHPAPVRRCGAARAHRSVHNPRRPAPHGGSAPPPGELRDPVRTAHRRRARLAVRPGRVARPVRSADGRRGRDQAQGGRRGARAVASRRVTVRRRGSRFTTRAHREWWKAKELARLLRVRMVNAGGRGRGVGPERTGGRARARWRPPGPQGGKQRASPGAGFCRPRRARVGCADRRVFATVRPPSQPRTPSRALRDERTRVRARACDLSLPPDPGCVHSACRAWVEIATRGREDPRRFPLPREIAIFDEPAASHPAPPPPADQSSSCPPCRPASAPPRPRQSTPRRPSSRPVCTCAQARRVLVRPGQQPTGRLL
mmetsp:Transcript_26843/g.86678  ORF Transcript_26843/g.86678 Transcript_26843/m.86678 type:complete len:323 (-) Transcript_26843:1582-2550(-)